MNVAQAAVCAAASAVVLLGQTTFPITPRNAVEHRLTSAPKRFVPELASTTGSYDLASQSNPYCVSRSFATKSSNIKRCAPRLDRFRNVLPLKRLPAQFAPVRTPH